MIRDSCRSSNSAQDESAGRANPPPQLGQTLPMTSSTQVAQKTHIRMSRCARSAKKAEGLVAMLAGRAQGERDDGVELLLREAIFAADRFFRCGHGRRKRCAGSTLASAIPAESQRVAEKHTKGEHQQRDGVELVNVRHEIRKAVIGDKRCEAPLGEKPEHEAGETADGC